MFQVPITLSSAVTHKARVLAFVQQGNSLVASHGFPFTALQNSLFLIVGDETTWVKIIAKYIFNDDTSILMSRLICVDISIKEETTDDLFDFCDPEGFDGIDIVNVQIYGSEFKTE
jgi:hypothetical protein